MQTPAGNQKYKGEALYQKMIEEVEDYAILLLSNEGKIVNWNKGAEKIKGYLAQEIIGKHFSLFYTKEDRNINKPEFLLKKAATEGKASEEGWRVRKGGTTFWGSIVITALHDEQGGVIGFTKVTRDLTERKLTEDRLRENARLLERQNKELEQFAYIASHDLQEPLRTVSAFVELLKEQYLHQLDAPAQQYINYVIEASNRMRELITGLLEFSRLGRERKLESIDMQQLMAQVLEDVQGAVMETGARIEINQLPVLNGYRVELKLLFLNLLSNAIKFRRKDISPYVTISATAKARGWEFAVTDNGIGIDPKFFEKIFVIFQRLNNRKEYKGTGIGLAHCKKIVELHGGEIRVDSKPGAGTTFFVFLPDKHI